MTSTDQITKDYVRKDSEKAISTAPGGNCDEHKLLPQFWDLAASVIQQREESRVRLKGEAATSKRFRMLEVNSRSDTYRPSQEDPAKRESLASCQLYFSNPYR